LVINDCFNQRMRNTNSQCLRNLFYAQYLIKQRKVNECIINLTNRILKQAAYFWMSEAEISVTNNLCAQRMH